MGNSMSRSCYLFALPSFTRGLSRILDIGGTLTTYNELGAADEADLKMLSLDWAQVGDDLFKAMNEHEHAQSKT